MVLEVRWDVGVWTAENLSGCAPGGASWQRVPALNIGRLAPSYPTPDLNSIVCPLHSDDTAAAVVEAITISICPFIVDTATSWVGARGRAVIVAICGEKFPSHSSRVASDLALPTRMQGSQSSLTIADALDDVNLTTVGPRGTFSQCPV